MLYRLIIAVGMYASSAFCQSEMQMLAAAFSGRWTITDKSEPSTTYPNGLTRMGEEDWHTLAGGIPLIEEYRSKAPDGAEEFDTAAFWWDQSAHKYAGLFCARTVDEGCAPFAIVWGKSTHKAKGAQNATVSGIPQGEVVMSGEYRQNGKRQVWREVFVFSTADNFVQTLFMGDDANNLQRVAIISAARVKGAR